MEILWYGHSCFRITERNMATVVTDPYDHKVVGYEALKLKGDIVTVSHEVPGHNYLDAVKGSQWHITGAGEYEIGGVFLTAVATGKNGKSDGNNMVFVFDYDGVTVAHLGDMNTVPSRKEVELFGTVDVLLIPVGGGGGLNAAKAAEVISLIEPSYVIPMHYATPKSKLKLNTLSQFVKEMGLGKNVEEQESLKISRGTMPEETRVVVLSYKH